MSLSNLQGSSFKDNNLDLKLNNNIQEAVFAMGCFWCGAAAFTRGEDNAKINGIISTIAGYSDGPWDSPSYEKHEGHREVVQIVFDSNIITYEKLLDIFWVNIDPFDDKGQFCDRGNSYLSAIYYQDTQQLLKAFKSKEEKEKLFEKKIVTTIEPLTKFYKAELEHQDYKINNPIKYKYYLWNCGRDRRLHEIWSEIKIETTNIDNKKFIKEEVLEDA